MLHQRLCQSIDRFSGELISLARSLAERPEIAFEERESSRQLVSYLKSKKFIVENPYLWLETAFRAHVPMKEKGLKIAFLAEYDALPEIGHACGHHLIAAMSIGAALALAEMKNELAGEVIVMGTPAEEQGGGKALLADAGAFDDLDLALMIHPSDRTELITQTLAMHDVTFEFRGVAAHAAAFPTQGKNALDAAVATYQGVSLLRQQLPSDARVHGIILDGGKVPNIIPDYTRMRYFVRAKEMRIADEVLQKIIYCARGGAMATSTEVEVTQAPTSYYPINSNEKICSLLANHLAHFDISYDLHCKDEVMGSSDIGNVSWLVPTIHPTLQICDRGVACHTKGFAEAASTPRAFEMMIKGAKALACTAADILTSQKIYEKIRQEFTSRTGKCSRLA